MTLASVPVPLLDSTTQVCWKSDNPSPPDTILIPPGTQYGATLSKAGKEKLLRYRGLQACATLATAFITRLGRSSKPPLTRLSFAGSADPRSADDLEIEDGLLESAEQPQPDRHNHLRSPRSAMSPRSRMSIQPKPGAARSPWPSPPRRRRRRTRCVRLSELGGIDHQVGVHGVQGLDHPGLDDLLCICSPANRCSTPKARGHALREVQRVRYIYEDLPSQVLLAGQIEPLRAAPAVALTTISPWAAASAKVPSFTSGCSSARR